MVFFTLYLVERPKAASYADKIIRFILLLEPRSHIEGEEFEFGMLKVGDRV